MDPYKLGEMEQRLADLIWRHAPLRTRELVGICQQEFGWKRTTTYTMLKRLCEKGIFRNEGGVVTAVLSRSQFYSMQSQRFVEETFSGSLPAFIAAFTSSHPLSETERKEILAIIEKGERKP